MPHFGLNRVLLIGQVASAPRFKITSHKQMPRLWFRLRTRERYHDPAGAEKERQAFHTIVVWGNHARALEAFLREHQTVAVDGRLASHAYELAGQKRYETEVVASCVVVQTPRPAEAGADAA